MGFKKFLATAMTAGMMLSFIPQAVMADGAGWQGNNTDGWRYSTSDGNYLSSTWQKIGGSWYYFDAEGYALINKWAYIDGALYHFNGTGAMETNKWINCGEYKVWGQTEEYAGADPEFAEVLNEYRGKKLWRYVGENGAAYTGWKKVNGEWYHFNDTLDQYNNYLDINECYQSAYAVMTYGAFKDKDGSRYNFDGNGKYRKNCWYKGFIGYGDTGWYYYGADGKAYSGWKNINGKWYCFGTDDYGADYMFTGYREFYDGGVFKAYKFGSDGVLMTGWNKSEYVDEDTGKTVTTWTYSGSDGRLYFNEWLNYGGKWYYFSSSTMVADKTDYVINGKKYNFDANGVCTNYDGDNDLEGWHVQVETYGGQDHEYWFYLDSSGNRIRSQWLLYNNSWFYFDDLGWMISNKTYFPINGKYYSFDKNGKCTTPNGLISATGWVKHCPGDYSSGEECWFYYGSDGRYYTGWKSINGKWYHFSKTGVMTTGLFVDDDDSGKTYYLRNSGELAYGWISGDIDGRDNWYYADSSGVLYTNKWLNYKGVWYYFTKGMVKDYTDYLIDGKYYDFDANGKCLNPDSGRIYVQE